MRIYIMGNSGQGKSTVAKRLAKRTGITSYDMDDLFWRPNWQQISDEEKACVLEDIGKKERWIVSGNYASISAPIRKSAEYIIMLQYPYYVNMWRSIKRSIVRAWTKEKVCNGNVETWRKLLTKDSVILWAHGGYKKNVERGKQWQAEMPDKIWLVVRNKKDLEKTMHYLEVCAKGKERK